MEKMATPKVYPLRGAVEQALAYYYTGNHYSFPPPGFLLEVTFFKMDQDQVGKFERENLDLLFLAWLMKGEQAKDNPDELAKFRESAQNVLMHFNLRDKDDDKLSACYHHRENEENNAEFLGHSVLSRARELASIQERL